MIQYDSWCCQSCSSFTRSSTFSFASRHALNRCTWQKKFKVKYREKQQKMAKGITKSWHQKHGKMWVLKLRKSVPPALSDPTTSSKRRSSARCDSSPGNLQEREKGKVTGNFPQFPGLPGYLQRVTPSYRPVTSVRNDLKEPRVPTFQTKDQQNFDGVAERYLSQGKVMTSVLECLTICFFCLSAPKSCTYRLRTTYTYLYFEMDRLSCFKVSKNQLRNILDGAVMTLETRQTGTSPSHIVTISCSTAILRSCCHHMIHQYVTSKNNFRHCERTQRPVLLHCSLQDNVTAHLVMFQAMRNNFLLVC